MRKLIHKKLVILFVACLAFGGAHAQFVADYVAAADKYFAAGDYYSATQYYEKALGQKKSKTGAQSFNPYDARAAANKKIVIAASDEQKVIYNLGESYRNLHFHIKALPYYEQAAGFDAAKYPLAKYYYATTLRALEKYDESAAAFGEFLSGYATSDKYSDNAKREVANISYIKTQLTKSDLSSYTVNKNASLNADGGTYAPLWVDGSTLWFTSTRTNGSDANKNNVNKIYQASYTNGVAANSTVVNLPQPKDMQQGVAAMTPGGKKVFLTRWSVAKEKRTASIYESTNENGKWSEPVLSALNAEGSNTQQPFVMADGKHILFSSDRPGGQGGYDLYVAGLDESGNAGTASNMGVTINSKYDEQAPSYHDASKTLVFSCNGNVGMGGYDLFYSKGEMDNMAAPVNFGYPVNSIKDDIYFTSRGSARNILEDVILSSDRDAACCLELFSLKKEKPMKQLTGMVKDCATGLPLANVKVVIMDTINNIVISEKMTDANGTYTFTMEEFMPLKATGSETGYFNNSVRFVGPADKDEVMYSNPIICLKKIPDVAIKVDNVYYDFNKASLQETSFASLDELVTLLNENPTMQIELGAHTDSKGADEYNQKLSDERAQSVVDYLISKGIDKDRLVAKGYGETQPVAENENADGSDNPEGRQLNRRTEFKVIKN